MNSSILIVRGLRGGGLGRGSLAASGVPAAHLAQAVETVGQVETLTCPSTVRFPGERWARTTYRFDFALIRSTDQHGPSRGALKRVAAIGQ